MEQTGVATFRLPPASEDTAWAALAEFGRSLTGAVRVVVLTGPAGAFARDDDPVDDVERARLREGAADWLRRPDLLSLAAIRGPARDSGFALGLSCDLRVCAVDTDFALAVAAAGRLPGLGALGRLETLLGYPRSLELALTGRRMSAMEAAAFGLVNLVVAADDVDAAAADLAAALLSVPHTVATEVKALLSGAPSTVRRGAADRAAAEFDAAARLAHDLRSAPS